MKRLGISDEGLRRIAKAVKGQVDDEMEVYDFTDPGDDNVGAFYATQDHILVDSIEEATDEYGGPVAEILVHGMYPGSLDDMRARAQRLYDEARAEEDLGLDR